MEAFKAHVEQGLENSADTSEAPYPRWIRINTINTTLEDQLDTTFAGFERVATVDAVRHRGSKRLFIDGNIPNLIAISPVVDLSKSDAYRSGAIIFQDKASCFPAYLLDPLPEDGDIIDSCSAPGNKTTHIAAILLSHNADPDNCTQTIHAFEKNKGRAETLEKMVNLAGSHTRTKLHPGHDFLKADPESAAYKHVGALLLDPSCSGSGIVGRDDMPELHLPVAKQGVVQPKPMNMRNGGKPRTPAKETLKRKREPEEDINVMVDDDGEVTAVNTEDELKTRLAALSEFQTQLLVHALKFPSARKVTYSTCSIHAEENEVVVKKALESEVAKERGWRIQTRDQQIRGMKEWPVRGSLDACDGDKTLADACIRANKGDEHGTMGFFLAGFVRDQKPASDLADQFLRDERGHLVRDLLGVPVRKDTEQIDPSDQIEENDEDNKEEEEEEWGGFGDEPKTTTQNTKTAQETPEDVPKPPKQKANSHYHAQGRRPNLVSGKSKAQKRRKQ